MELDSGKFTPTTYPTIPSDSAALSPVATQTTPGTYYVIRRNGKLTAFDPSKISVAMTKAFLAIEGGQAAASSRIHETVETLSTQIEEALTRRMPTGGTVHIEDIQDQVELALMRGGEHKIARAYVLYRNERAQARQQDVADEPADTPLLQVTGRDGSLHPLDEARLEHLVTEACQGLEAVSAEQILTETLKNLFDGVNESDVTQALIMSARTLIEQEPNYSYVAARLLLDTLRSDALMFLDMEVTTTDQAGMQALYPEYFTTYLKAGVEHELLDAKLLQFDLNRISQALVSDRDHQFNYLGLQTLFDRYFLHCDDTRIELPQAFFMRVAMGLAVDEIDREGKAIEFYELLSSFRFMSSTPTLFNSGTLRPQLSSCYLTSIPDDLGAIYGAMRDNALLSKYAGGLGNDWTQVRALGAHIKGTNGKSQGVVPFLKVASDTAVAVNQGGKRKGAVCAYLETWHLDIEEFLELRKNTGDDRRRTHDMNTANWVPDLFMKRVFEGAEWTLFSPNMVPDLHDKFGDEFEQAYLAYEAKADAGEITPYKRVSAIALWRKMLTQIFETGHPWMAFKDPCNIRSPQQHMGTVHSSNLCTEITLNTSESEIAVCNLGSVNLPAHVDGNGLNMPMLEETINTAMRMLDNVIDINYYSVPQARKSNLRHRPVGLGIMGFQDALYLQNIAYSSDSAISFADQSMEAVSYFTIKASCELAQERGKYPSYEGSLWSQGVLPIDSITKLQDYRQQYLEVDTSSKLDWSSLRHSIEQHGMRNSNTMAIAPTATISNICGVSQSIEPTYQNLFVKSNLSGEFTVVNPHLVKALKARNLWDSVMVNDLKYYDGSVAQIDRIPADLKALFATAFEIDSSWLVEAASRRQKWIDQAQSLNLYMSQPSGKKLDDLYRLAWTRGLKTTYYLRSLGATSTEKSTITDGALNAVSIQPPQACSINDPECEACQ
ncbi:MAG: ribonucleoside-diphosphate reductase subunit alpha [Methylococcales bacterium]|nr:ribonucleoside-diphosphate reductase subunit alpha [Methylococcales bacterium]